MSRKAKIWIGVGLYLAITIGLLIIFGNEGKNDAFQPQNEFKLDPWINIEIGGIDLSINKAVFYLILASVCTVATMVFIASLFLLGVWFFLNRLKNEQAQTNREENRDNANSGTGSHPDAPQPGRDFTPQADLLGPDDY